MLERIPIRKVCVLSWFAWTLITKYQLKKTTLPKKNGFVILFLWVLYLYCSFQENFKVLWKFYMYILPFCHLLLKLNNEELLLFVYEKRFFLISGKYYIYSHLLHSFDTKLLKKRIIHKSIFLTTIFSYKIYLPIIFYIYVVLI